MNEVVNKFLLLGSKFILEMHLRQAGFKYSACGSFTICLKKQEIEEIPKRTR